MKPESRSLAKAISNMLQEFPQYEVVVSGHTDNIPISNSQYKDNWDLSADRALNFLKILLLNDALDPAKFTLAGMVSITRLPVTRPMLAGLRIAV